MRHSLLNNETDRTLLLYNLAATATDEAVFEVCTQRGGLVKAVRLKFDRETGRPKGFGFVTFYNREHAQKFLDYAKTCDGPMKVRWASEGVSMVDNNESVDE